LDPARDWYGWIQDQWPPRDGGEFADSETLLLRLGFRMCKAENARTTWHEAGILARESLVEEADLIEEWKILEREGGL
jgi:hypothetical protein